MTLFRNGIDYDKKDYPAAPKVGLTGVNRRIGINFLKSNRSTEELRKVISAQEMQP